MKVAEIAAARDPQGGAVGMRESECRKRIQFLADACDGAHSQDAKGFSRWDKDLGFRLARAKHWTDDMLNGARRLCHKYRRQLARFDRDTRDEAAVRSRRCRSVRQHGEGAAHAERRGEGMPLADKASRR